MSLIVEDFDSVTERVFELVRSHRGYVAKSEIYGAPRSPRYGRWTIRAPVDQFQGFLKAVEKLGVPERNSTDSEDLTAEYVDFEARIKNKKEQEETLRGYLRDRKGTSQLKDILAIEQELSRARGEIEQAEGQFRMLTSLTALTTIRLSVQEMKNYVPPQAPSFGTSMTRTFTGSLETFVGFSKACMLGIVAAVPWLPLSAAILFTGWLALRWLKRLVRASRALPDEAAPA